MAATQIKMITENEFDGTISQGTVLVDFHADWCGPCRTLAPVLETVAEEMGSSAKIVKIDIDKAQGVATRFHVSSIPTMILFKHGKESGRLVGLNNATAIKKFLQS
jgi:thioredoxin 1